MTSRKNFLLVCAACILLDMNYDRTPAAEALAVSLQRVMMEGPDGAGSGSNENIQEIQNAQLVPPHGGENVEGSEEHPVEQPVEQQPVEQQALQEVIEQQPLQEVIDSAAAPQAAEIQNLNQEIHRLNQEVNESGGSRNRDESGRESALFDYGMFQSRENALEVLKLLPPAEQEIVGLIGKAFGNKNNAFTDSLSAATGARDPERRFLRKYAQLDQHLSNWPDVKVRKFKYS
jgi:hypothetical protein